jgi:hypothetical protein
MNFSMPGSSCRLAMPRPLCVVVRPKDSRVPLARERVSAADLADAVAETWRDQCLRRGFPELALAEVPMTLVPLRGEGEDGPRCIGFALEVELPDGMSHRQEFSLLCLAPAISRALQPLTAAGGDSLSGGNFSYEVALEALSPDPLPQPPASPSFAVHVRSLPPACLRVPFRPLVHQATAVDLDDDGVFPVFFTRKALAKAEACSRAGTKSVPPVESGGVLIGSLAFCDSTREFFVIITDALEVNDAEQTPFSLSYSGKSWDRIQAIMKARQAAHPRRVERLLGQCHGHNFLPHNGRRCEECDRRPVCGLTSVFASSDDRTWMRAVFARQPWALCQIFGLTARNEPVHKVFSLKDASWQPRGYFLLPDFDIEHAADPDVPRSSSASLRGSTPFSQVELRKPNTL